MFGSTGTVVARYDYDPYGRSTTILGTTPTDLNFTGLYRHSKSSLDLAVHRAYDADLGRWLSRDPVAEGGGLNLYAYVGNRPALHTDPLGLFVEPIPLAQKAAYRVAWQHLIANPEMHQIFTAVNRADATFTVNFVSSPQSNGFHPNLFSVGGVIDWDPSTANVFPGGVQPPAFALAHEFAHAADMVLDTGGFLGRCRSPGNIDEELHVINGVEKRAALDLLGYVYRNDHRAALNHYAVSSPW